MKSMSRKFGGLTSSKSADEADVSSILHDFKVADEMLDTVSWTCRVTNLY